MFKRKDDYADVPSSLDPVRGIARALYIVTYRWQVVFEAGDAYCDGERTHGWTDFYQQCIHIAGSQTRALQRTTLIHEVAHAIEKSHSNCNIHDAEESAQASEVGWHSVIRDWRNDWFFSFVREGRDER